MEFHTVISSFFRFSGRYFIFVGGLCRVLKVGSLIRNLRYIYVAILSDEMLY
jgi:hypothetical protein